jgi:hypothetical protein
MGAGQGKAALMLDHHGTEAILAQIAGLFGAEGERRP